MQNYLKIGGYPAEPLAKSEGRLFVERYLEAEDPTVSMDCVDAQYQGYALRVEADRLGLSGILSAIARVKYGGSTRELQ